MGIKKYLKESSKYPHRGFTIVELLIVIVVIAILATISIVAYNGIQSRAKASEASYALSQAKKKLELYKVDNGSYPTTGNLADAGVTNSDVSYQYTSSNGSTYCITGTAGTVSYKASDTTNPTAGGCAGHGQGGVAAITNLMTNPSLESNLSGWNASGAASIARATGSSQAGGAYLNLTRTTSGDPYSSYTLSGPAPADTPYTLSFWVWADSPTTLYGNLIFRVYNSGSCCSNLSTINGQSVSTTPTKVIMSGTTSSNPTSGLQIILRPLSSIGSSVYYDGFMITEGLSSYAYADGDSTDWTWNGTVNNSTSTGPPL